MLFELFISLVAFSKSIDAYELYETKSMGLGESFLTPLETTYQKIAHSPKSYS